MRLEGVRDREHGLADVILLLAAVCMALATWVAASGPAGVPLWKSYIGVVITVFLALAALTRNARWAAFIRLLTGGWLIAAPCVLTFAHAAATWACLVIGMLVIALAIPRLANPRMAITGLAVPRWTLPGITTSAARRTRLTA